MRLLFTSIFLLCFCYSQQIYKQFPLHQKKASEKQLNSSEILWNNDVRFFGGGVVSTELSGLPLNQRSIEVVDDFNIPNGFTWSIDSIYAIGTPVNNPNEFRVTFYNDLDGNVGSVLYSEDFVAPNSVLITHQLASPILLGQGNYWFSVVAVYEDSTSFSSASWYWDSSPDEQRFEARVKDFTGQSGLDTWTPFSQVPINERSVVFRLYGADLTSPVFKDSIALVDFYNTAGGANWTISTNWLSANPLSTWYGLTIENNRLVELDLASNNLTGNIEFLINYWTEIRKVDLSGNQLEGQLTEDFFELDSIEYLNLSDNSLNSFIPEIIFSPPKLSYLDLSNNQLFGDIISAGDSTGSIKYLDLSHNKLTFIPRLNFNLDTMLINDNNLVFVSIEPNLDRVQYMDYTNQDSVGVAVDTIIQKGFGFSVLVNDFAESNEYVWYLNDIEIERTFNSLFQRDSLDFDDSGVYRYEITNSVANQIIIPGRPLNIQIRDINTSLLIFQNPSFTQKFKAILRSDIPLKESPIIRLNNFILPTIKTDSNSQNYSSSFSIGSNGTYTIKSRSVAEGNLLEELERQFTITIVPVDSAKKIQTVRQNLKLLIPANSLSNSTVFYAEKLSGNHYKISPNINLLKPAQLEVQIGDQLLELNDIALYLFDGKQDIYVKNQVHIDNKIIANVYKTGEYILKQKFDSDKIQINDFKLYANYPNPFNPSTTIRYDLTRSSYVQLDIINILGQKIRTLVDEEQIANSYKYEWDGKNRFGRIVASGIYFYRMRTKNRFEINKMIFIK